MWVVFDQALGRFGHPCGPFWAWTMGRFGSWAVLVISHLNRQNSTLYDQGNISLVQWHSKALRTLV